MAFKKLIAIGAIDPIEHQNKALWVVYGSYPQAPQLMAVCCSTGYGGEVNIWGYSQWSGKAAYRTIGQALTAWITNNTTEKFEPKFFDHQALALDYMRILTEPRCEPLEKR
jgi:hypothetical protein